MRELQEALSKKDSTPELREAARRELESLLRAPGAAQSQAPANKLPPRAAIQPFPPIEAPVVKFGPPVDPSDVARLEVVGPQRAIVNPRTGSTIAPLGSTVIDTRTGRVLQETPSGYLDPRTGQLIPK